MSDYTKIVILCEDRQQEVFARRFLEACGVNWRRIYTNVCPKGKQAGEQYVRENYPREVASYRQIAHRLTAGLVVLSDADIHTVADRYQQLDRTLEDNHLPRRQSGERIGVFIPKRNIETWIHHLMGQTVTEEDIYPHLRRESECRPYAEELARNRHAPLPEGAPVSLHTACQELPRILPEDL